MVVAHLLGEGAPALARLGPRVPLLPADRLLLFGFDDPDDLGEEQQALLARHAPTAWPASTGSWQAAGGPRAAAAAALADLEARAGTVVVHFDVDVVDSGDLPLANFPRFNQGLTLADAVACLEVFCGSARLGGLVVTEVRPRPRPRRHPARPAGRRSGGRARPAGPRHRRVANESFVTEADG